MLLLLSIIFSSTSAFAETVNYDVIIDPALNLTLSSNTVSFNLNPVSQAFNSGNLTATVSTNNPNGYKLYLNANTTDLVRQNDGTAADSLNAVIETLSTSIAETSFPVNKWGYRISSGTSGDSTITSTTNYYPFVSNKLISSTTEPTNSEVATLSFAAKADYNKPAGQYNLSLNFKALPQVTQKYMQEIETADCTEDPTMVMDKRDGHLYAIARLKDGKCWMVQNLRLGENLETTTGSLTLTSEDTNLANNTTFNLTNKLVNGVMPYKGVSDPDVGSGTYFIYDVPAFYCASSYGCYYNFYTATAGAKAEGEGAVTTNNTDISTSICPKGWALPVSGEHNPNTHKSDFRLLANAYGGTDATAAAALLVNPTNITENVNGASLPGFTLGGSTGGDLSGVNETSTLWSRTVFSMSHSYGFMVTTSRVNTVGPGNKYNGRSIRCLLQESE